MAQRILAVISCVCLSFCLAACASDTAGSDAQPVPSFDVILGSDEADDTSEQESVFPEKTNEELENELSEYALELESKIKALEDKIQALTELKASYEAENPPDLINKLAHCDALIAQAQAELDAFVERLEQNKQSLSSLNNQSDDLEPAPEDLPPQDFLPEDFLPPENPIDE